MSYEALEFRTEQLDEELSLQIKQRLSNIKELFLLLSLLNYYHEMEYNGLPTAIHLINSA